MSTQAISASEIGGSSAYNASDGKISELTRLEQNIKNMKSEYEKCSKSNGPSSPDINAKIKELDSLIYKVQQQIEQIKRNEKKDGTGTSKKTASGTSSYRYLGSAASIYKRAFSLAHRAQSEASAALSGNLHAPSAACTASTNEIKESIDPGTGKLQDAMCQVTTVQAKSPDVAINAAFSEGIDITK